MYLIENGTPYLLQEDGSAVRIEINLDKSFTIKEDEVIEAEGKTKYSYDELTKKLNIDYFIEEKKKHLQLKENESEIVKELNSKISELEDKYNESLKENEILSKRIEELEKSDSEGEPDENPKKDKVGK